MTQTDRHLSCPACGDEDIDKTVETFDGVCTACGFVIHDRTKTSAPDWMVVEGSDQEDEQDWLRTSRVRNATEQQLVRAFDYIEMISDRLDLPTTIRSDAADVYCEAFLEETTKGRDTPTLIAACVRLAALECGQPIPTSRLTDGPNINARQCRQSYTALCADLDRTPPMPNPIDFLPFLTERLTLDEVQHRAAEELLEDVTDHSSLVGKDPVGVAAAALYVCSGDTTQSDVADTGGVSTETIRQRTGHLKELRNDG